MAELQAGVVGAGLLGSAHARNLDENPQTRVAAVCDLRMEAAQAVAGPLGAQAFGDVHEMLRSHSLDLVVVATPDAFHREPSMAAMEAGVPNIIQEKPLATTVEDALALYEAVEQRGTRFFVNYANRTAPMDIATCYVIRQGLLGDVVYGEARLDDNISVPTRLWGDRSRTWAAGSSTAHFLLSHVVDLLRWYLHPAEVQEVYAIKQERVLGFTPDLYDAHLLFDNGARMRVKAEWIKHMDELVEFYMSFSGSEGMVIYNKLAAFGARPSWRANLSQELDTEQLLGHQNALLEAGANLRALVHRPTPSAVGLSTEGDNTALALESWNHSLGKSMALQDYCVDAILGDTLQPEAWKGPGPLPTHHDGLMQSLIVSAIIASADEGRVVALSELT